MSTLNDIAAGQAALDDIARRGSLGDSQDPIASRCLADVAPERVRWLWPGRIARGKVTVLAGNPGLGKSQITASLAAIVTTGGQWPVDRARADVGSVVILSAEDDAADTISPRMLAAGADTCRVHVIDAVRCASPDGKTGERAFDLTRDLPALAARLHRIGDVALLVIDPITAYMGATDSHRNAEVRAVLAPVSALAAQCGAAVVAVSHLNKGAGNDAQMRVTGSLAFVAAARAAWLVAKDPENPARRLFLPMKNNIGPDAAGLSFTIEPATVDEGIETSRVTWGADPVLMTANDALAADVHRDVGDDAPQRGEAVAWLQEALAAGPVAAGELKRMARADGIAWRTVERAKRSLEVSASRHGYGPDGRWAWELPTDIGRQRPPVTNDVAVFGADDAGNIAPMRVSPKAASSENGGGLCAQDGGLWAGGGLCENGSKTATKTEVGGLCGDAVSTPIFDAERPKTATLAESRGTGGLWAGGAVCGAVAGTEPEGRPPRQGQCTSREYEAVRGGDL